MNFFQSISFRDVETVKYEQSSCNNMTNAVAPEANPEIVENRSSDPSYRNYEIKDALELYKALLDNYSGADLAEYQEDYKILIKNFLLIFMINN